MKWKMLLLFVFGGCAILNAKGQLRLASLQDVWTYADEHNLQVQAAVSGKATAGVNVKQSYGVMLPMVSANGSFTDNMTIQPTLIPAGLFNPGAPPGTFTETTFGRRYIYNGNVTVQLSLLNTGDWFAIKAAKLNEEIASLNIAKTKADLYGELANAYYSYILLAEAAKLSKDNLLAASISYSLAANRYAEGLVSEVSVNLARINQEKAAKSLELAEQNKLLQLNSMKLLLNTNDSISLMGQADLNNVLQQGSAAVPDPDVQLSAMRMNAAKNQWRSAKAAYVPVLSAVYQYSTQIAADEFMKFGNSNSLPQQYWGIRLSVPIFSGGARSSQTRKAAIDYDLKRKEYDNARLRSEINDKNRWISYYSSLNAYSRSKEILALYQSNDMHAEMKLSEGVISLDDRLKVYADLVSSQNEYLQSMSDYMIQQYRLKIRQINFIQ